MVVAKEIAQEEVNSWLDAKKITPQKRETFEAYIEQLVNGICNGALSLNPETKVFTYTLSFPTEGDAPITKLDFKPRLKLSTVTAHLQGVKSTDGDGRLTAYVAALTGQPKGVINALDTEDYSACLSIAVFFA